MKAHHYHLKGYFFILTMLNGFGCGEYPLNFNHVVSDFRFTGRDIIHLSNTGAGPVENV